MAEIQIDSDWKKQAQEEKRRLAEEAEKKKAAVAPAPAAQSASSTTRDPGGRVTPTPGLESLVQLLSTQVLYYLGELGADAGEGSVNLDMAKHQIDTLNVLEEKTRGNLTAEEQSTLDNALYDTRMRFVSVAQQYIR